MDTFVKLQQIVLGLNRRFGDSDNPFQIITRLAEECGELAQQVNHFENMGVKREAYGPPDREHLAKEVQDVIRCALQIAVFYGIDAELEQSIERSYQQLRAEGFIAD